MIFCARICCRDCFQIRLEPAQCPAEPQPGAPAGRLGTQPGQASTDGVNGLLDDNPRLRDRQRMSQEQRRRLLKAPPRSTPLPLVRQALPRCSQVPDVPRGAGPRATDPPRQVIDQPQPVLASQPPTDLAQRRTGRTVLPKQLGEVPGVSWTVVERVLF